MHVQFTGPFRDLAEMQLHQRVRIVDHGVAPGMRSADGHADLLVQFAPQGFFHRFALFQLAARKLPVARIHLALRPTGQQEVAIRLQQHPHSNLHQLARGTLRHIGTRPVAIGHQRTLCGMLHACGPRRPA